MSKMYDDRRLEALLRSYPVLKADALIEQQELFNLFPNCIANYSGIVRGRIAGDSTATMAIARANIPDSMKKVRAIEISFGSLDGAEKELVKLLYFEKCRVYQVQHQLHISRSVFFRIRRSALDKIAGRLIRLDLFP